jgi:uncharacterized protein (DUF1697 family)
VRTYIASGNALVDSDLSPKEIEEKVHDLIKKHIGPDLVVIVRTGDQLQKVLDENPFTEEKGHDISRAFFMSFKAQPDAGKVKEILAQDYGEEKLVITKKAGYMYIPGSAARSILSNNGLEKKLGVSATTRNYNTTRKLIEMSEEKG